MRNLDPGDESLALAKHLLNNQCNEIKKRGNQVANYIKDIRSKVGHMPIFLNAVAGAVVNDQGQILLQRRTDAGNWSLPGGMMEYGETFVETLKREMKEDAGLMVEPVKPLHTFEQGFTTYPNGDQAQIICRLYLVKPVGGGLEQADPNETLALKYFNFDQLPPLFNTQSRDMIACVRAYLDGERQH